MEVVHVEGVSAESKRLRRSAARSLKRLCTVPVLWEALIELLRFFLRPLLDACKKNACQEAQRLSREHEKSLSSRKRSHDRTGDYDQHA
jgi:hypothetical protein